MVLYRVFYKRYVTHTIYYLPRDAYRGRIIEYGVVLTKKYA